MSLFGVLLYLIITHLVLLFYLNILESRRKILQREKNFLSSPHVVEVFSGFNKTIAYFCRVCEMFVIILCLCVTVLDVPCEVNLKKSLRMMIFAAGKKMKRIINSNFLALSTKYENTFLKGASLLNSPKSSCKKI